MVLLPATLLLFQSFHLCLWFCMGYIRTSSERMQALPGMVYPHESKEQGLMAITRQQQKCNLHLFPSDCPESKCYQPSAPPPVWLSNADWWLHLGVPKPCKGSQEKPCWRGKYKINQRSLTARWVCKHPPQDKETEINESPSISIITEVCKCSYYTCVSIF